MNWHKKFYIIDNRYILSELADELGDVLLILCAVPVILLNTE